MTKRVKIKYNVVFKKILQKNNKKRRILHKKVELYKYRFRKDYEVN